MLNGKRPAVAGDVPPQPVMVLEKAQLPVGGIADAVFVQARWQRPIGVAYVQANAICMFFRVPGLVAAIALHGYHGEVHAVVIAQRVFVVSGEFAVDASADLLAFRLHPDGFVYSNFTCSVNLDFRVVSEDAFVSMG
jgi:hypothetical protein